MKILRWRPDILIVIILCATVLAFIIPMSDKSLQFMTTLTSIMIALLFFLYGTRLSLSQLWHGVKNWKLQGLIGAFTFIVFPLIGVALYPTRTFLGPELYTGVLFLCLVPGTVQSSVTFTSIAKGNVPAAVVGSSLSNTVGVFLTPILVYLLIGHGLGGTGTASDSAQFATVQFNTDSIQKILIQMLLPFVLGLLTHKYLATYTRSKPVMMLDKLTIGLVVFAAFAQSIQNDIWSQISPVLLVALIVGSIILVSFMLWFTWWTAQNMGFDRADSITVQFCGTKKSLAAGLPMCLILFPAATAGTIILPLILFHVIQLLMCGQLAGKYAQENR